MKQETLNKIWDEKILSEVVEINNYPSLEKDKHQTYVAMDDLEPYTREIQGTQKKEYKYSAPRFKNGDTLFPKMSRCLELGKSAFVNILDENEVAFGSTEFIVMRPKRGQILPKYIYYTLRREDIRQHAMSWATGSTARRQRISTDFFDNVSIKLPPIETQQEIVSFLDALDSKIQKNKRINDLLEETIRTIYNFWFVNYDSFEVSKKTDYEMLPESWQEGTLGDLMEKKADKTDPENLSENNSYISLKHMPEQSLSLAKWDDAEDISSEKTKFSKKDILFGKLRPYFCKVGLAPVEGVCSTDILVIGPKRGAKWKEFLLCTLSDQSFIDYCDSVSTGTRMPRVGWQEMCEYKIEIPNEDTITEFNKIAHPYFELILNNIHEMNSLHKIRDTLLPKLLTGDIQLDSNTNMTV